MRHHAAFDLPPRINAAGRYIGAAVYGLAALFFAVVGALCAVRLCSSPSSVLTALLTAVLFVALCCVLWRVPSKKAALAAILAVAAAVRVWYVFTVPSEPVSDFALLYSSAEAAANGDFSWANVTEGYFAWWRYQIPFVLYEAAVIKLTHSVAALKLLNVVWGVGTVYLVFRLTRAFAGDYSALGAALFAAVCPAFVMYSSVLTNQHISLFFILLALVVLIEARSILGCAAAGALMALGNLMRPEAAIVIAALCCVALYAFLAAPSKKSLGHILLALAVTLLAYFAVQKAAELILAAIGVAPYGLGNSVPEWKLIVGLDLESGGTVSQNYASLLDIADPAERTAAIRAVIAAQLAEAAKHPAFFFEKLKYFWTSMEDTTFTLAGVPEWTMAAGALSVTEMVYSLASAELALRTAAYLFAAVACAHYARKSAAGRVVGGSVAPLCVAAVLCGTVLAYLFIEIQPRYRLFALPFVFVMAAAALGRIAPDGKRAWKN